MKCSGRKYSRCGKYSNTNVTLTFRYFFTLICRMSEWEVFFRRKNSPTFLPIFKHWFALKRTFFCFLTTIHETSIFFHEDIFIILFTFISDTSQSYANVSNIFKTDCWYAEKKFDCMWVKMRPSLREDCRKAATKTNDFYEYFYANYQLQ